MLLIWYESISVSYLYPKNLLCVSSLGIELVCALCKSRSNSNAQEIFPDLPLSCQLSLPVWSEISVSRILWSLTHKKRVKYENPSFRVLDGAYVDHNIWLDSRVFSRLCRINNILTLSNEASDQERYSLRIRALKWTARTKKGAQGNKQNETSRLHAGKNRRQEYTLTDSSFVMYVVKISSVS